MTEDKNIFNYFFSNNTQFLKTLPIIYEKKKINGNFLEKYLELFLKLKVVLAADTFYCIDNIFYNIEYITYINLGHGVKYFKHHFYKDYISYQKYNKLILPFSDKIISVAKRYGWKEENIIKIGLPKWDKYNKYGTNISSFHNKNISNKSIFVMFTWRQLKKNQDLSPYYLNNIIKLLLNIRLNKELKINNVNLFFCHHHNLKKRILNEHIINKNIKMINQSLISECLTNSNLIISDFSSIIFESIYRKIPYIMFIPDSNDSTIYDIYLDSNADIINGLKNDSIYFENKFFDLELVIDKIIYYIINNFTLEKKMTEFYDSFNLTQKNNTQKLINYLIKLE